MASSSSSPSRCRFASHSMRKDVSRTVAFPRDDLRCVYSVYFNFSDVLECAKPVYVCVSDFNYYVVHDVRLSICYVSFPCWFFVSFMHQRFVSKNNRFVLQWNPKNYINQRIIEMFVAQRFCTPTQPSHILLITVAHTRAHICTSVHLLRTRATLVSHVPHTYIHIVHTHGMTTSAERCLPTISRCANVDSMGLRILVVYNQFSHMTRSDIKRAISHRNQRGKIIL